MDEIQQLVTKAKRVAYHAGRTDAVETIMAMVNAHQNPTVETWIMAMGRIATDLQRQSIKIKEEFTNATAPPTPTANDAAAPHQERTEPDARTN